MYSVEALFDDTLDIANFTIQYIVQYRELQHIGKACYELSQHYRTLGICELLIEGSTTDFFHHLIDSAQTRRYFLERCQQEKVLDAPERRASLNAPFFDAIVADQWKLAHKIGKLSAKEIMLDFEYEDDFFYSQFLFELIDPKGADKSLLETYLEAWEEVLEGNEDVRYEICVAFLNQDQAVFLSALDTLLEEYRQHIEHEREFAYRFTDAQLVFIEALALLNIAQKLGFKTDKLYRFCPEIARNPKFPPYQPLSFPNLPLTR